MSKSSLLFLGKYNNYFNRIIKKLSSVEDYITAVGDLYRTKHNIDFNPNDGVTNNIIVNWSDKSGDTEVPVSWTPDYLVVYDANGIISRWFIMEFKRTRVGQYSATIKRDVIADNLNELLQCPVYIEKGTIKAIDSKLIYNSEGFQCNQIKKAEIPLKDRSECPWLVLYLNKKYLDDNASTAISITNPIYNDQIYKTIGSNIEDWEFYNKTFYCSDTVGYGFRIYPTGLGQGYEATCYDDNSFSTINLIPISFDPGLRLNMSSPSNVYSRLTSKVTQLRTSLRNSTTTTYSQIKSNSYVDNLSVYNDKFISASNGVYKVRVTISQQTEYVVANNSVGQPLFDSLMNAFKSEFPDYDRAESRSNNFMLKLKNTTVVSIDVEPATEFTATATLTNSKRTNSTMFDAICVPFADKDYGGGGIYFAQKQTFKSAIEGIIKAVGVDNILDYQLLPYSPIQSAIGLDGHIESKPGTFIEFKDVNNVNVVDAWIVLEPQTTFYINENIEVDNNMDGGQVLLQKWRNDCTMLRLCSPNYNGVFEFNIAKNGGVVNSFNVDMTLKPYNPYIHVNPLFAELYGEDFDDMRGLICQGDFSLPMNKDAWESYQIQNKTYQQMFNREINSLDLQQSVQRLEAGFGLTAGAIGAGGAGAITGAKLGGGYGAIAGAAIGLTAGTVGGIVDYSNMSTMQKDQRDLAIQKFNMSLQNIKALPYSLTKGDPLTYNYKWFPFIEIYECTEEETKAYYNKLTYEGMTVGVIDLLSNWTDLDYNSYIKGQLVRSTNLTEDTHMLNEINIELMKGVYL